MNASIVPGCTEAIRRRWRPRADRRKPARNRLPKRRLQQFHISGLCCSVASLMVELVARFWLHRFFT